MMFLDFILMPFFGLKLMPYFGEGASGPAPAAPGAPAAAPEAPPPTPPALPEPAAEPEAPKVREATPEDAAFADRFKNMGAAAPRAATVPTASLDPSSGAYYLRSDATGPVVDHLRNLDSSISGDPLRQAALYEKMSEYPALQNPDGGLNTTKANGFLDRLQTKYQEHVAQGEKFKTMTPAQRTAANEVIKEDPFQSVVPTAGELVERRLDPNEATDVMASWDKNNDEANHPDRAYLRYFRLNGAKDDPATGDHKLSEAIRSADTTTTAAAIERKAKIAASPEGRLNALQEDKDLDPSFAAGVLAKKDDSKVAAALKRYDGSPASVQALAKAAQIPLPPKVKEALDEKTDKAEARAEAKEERADKHSVRKTVIGSFADANTVLGTGSSGMTIVKGVKDWNEAGRGRQFQGSQAAITAQKEYVAKAQEERNKKREASDKIFADTIKAGTERAGKNHEAAEKAIADARTRNDKLRDNPNSNHSALADGTRGGTGPQQGPNLTQKRGVALAQTEGLKGGAASQRNMSPQGQEDDRRVNDLKAAERLGRA